MPTSMVEDIIQSGVKHTEYGDWLDGDERLDDIVENGVKKTSLKRGTRPFMVKDTIKNGVKETNPVDVMKFFDNKMEDALQNGVKETLRASYLNVDNVIQDGVKETNYDTDNYTDDVKEVIREGVKETKGHGFEQQNIIDDIVKDGIKETKTPGKDGDILSTIEWMEENKSTSYTKMIDDVIDNGVKEVVSYDEHKRGPVNTFGYIDDIIKEGEKINGTYAGGQRQSEKCKSVVEYGTKNPTD
jgi:tartrate dehydratase alpha subunit/fumarate hydratase class I-like protein